MRTRAALGAIAALGAVLTAPASAHHSPAAFDLDKEMIVEGTLTKFLFANPHTYLTVETVGTDGKRVSQDVEAGPISTMQPIGLTRDSLRVGEHIVVRASRSPSGRWLVYAGGSMNGGARARAARSRAMTSRPCDGSTQPRYLCVGGDRRRELRRIEQIRNRRNAFRAASS